MAEGRIHYYVSGGGLGAGPGLRGGFFLPGGPQRLPGGSSPPNGLPQQMVAPSGGFPGPPPGAGAPGPGDGVTRSIESWVTSHFRSITVGGTKVYDLGAAK